VVWNHLAAIVFFAGPLFYCGMWMAIAPAGFASLLEFGMRVLNVQRSLTSVPSAHAGIPGRLRAAVRCAGIVLVLFAIAL
jgi:hypothetical protein